MDWIEFKGVEYTWEISSTFVQGGQLLYISVCYPAYEILVKRRLLEREEICYQVDPLQKGLGGQKKKQQQKNTNQVVI